MKKNRIAGLIISLLMSLVLTAALGVSAFAQSMTQDQAVDKALKDAGVKKSQVSGLKVETDDGSYEIEFLRKSDKTEFEYEISANSGTITEKSVDYSYKKNKSKKKIGKTAARKKVAKFAGISYKSIRKCTCKFKRSHKQGKYTIKFTRGGKKYEYEVLAPTGKIVEYEWELID